MTPTQPDPNTSEPDPTIENILAEHDLDLDLEDERFDDLLDDLEIVQRRQVAKAVAAIADRVKAALAPLCNEATTEADNAKAERSLFLAKAHKNYADKLGPVIEMLNKAKEGE